MKVVVMVAAALTSAALFSPTALHAQAVQDADQLSATVSTRSLDLGTPAGRALYERRLNTQIQRMCSDTGRRDFAAQAAVRDCIASARLK